MTQSSSVVEPLKSCPFCGAEAYFIDEEPGNYMACCRDCSATSVVCVSRWHATAAWNRRSIPEPTHDKGLAQAVIDVCVAAGIDPDGPAPAWKGHTGAVYRALGQIAALRIPEPTPGGVPGARKVAQQFVNKINAWLMATGAKNLSYRGPSILPISDDLTAAIEARDAQHAQAREALEAERDAYKALAESATRLLEERAAHGGHFHIGDATNCWDCRARAFLASPPGATTTAEGGDRG